MDKLVDQWSYFEVSTFLRVSRRFGKFLNSCYRSRDSSVSIVTRPQAGRSGVRMPTGANTPRPSGAYPASFSEGTGVKVTGEWHWPLPASAGSENWWSCTSTHPICVRVVYRDKFTFVLHFVKWLPVIPAQWVCLFVVSVVMEMSMFSTLSGVLCLSRNLPGENPKMCHLRLHPNIYYSLSSQLSFCRIILAVGMTSSNNNESIN